MFFWNSLAFLMIQRMLAIWSLVPLPFLNPAWTCGSSRFMDCWSLAWRILSITLLAYKMNAIVWWFEHSLLLPFLEIGARIDLFQSCGHCWAFQICWHTEYSALIASSFRILNSSTGIPSPPLVLLAGVLSKAPLTSHSRMSGFEWETTPLWLPRLLTSFLYNFSVFYFHLFLISSASTWSLLFLSFIVSIFGWNVPLVSLISWKLDLDICTFIRNSDIS